MSMEFVGKWYVNVVRCECCREPFGVAELISNLCEPCYVRTYGVVGLDYFDKEQ